MVAIATRGRRSAAHDLGMGTGARENAPASLDDFNEKMMRFNEGPNCFGKIVANAGPRTGRWPRLVWWEMGQTSEVPDFGGQLDLGGQRDCLMIFENLTIFEDL